MIRESLEGIDTATAFVGLTRLGGCNYRMPVTRKGKSVYVQHPQQPERKFRVMANDFDSGLNAFREEWCIHVWNDAASRRMESERNWQT